MPLVPHPHDLANLRGHLHTENARELTLQEQPSSNKGQGLVDNAASPFPKVGWAWDVIYTILQRIPSRIGPQLPTAVICSWPHLLLVLPSFLSHSPLSLIPSPKQTTWTQLLVSGSPLGRHLRIPRCRFQSLISNWDFTFPNQHQTQKETATNFIEILKHMIFLFRTDDNALR